MKKNSGGSTYNRRGYRTEQVGTFIEYFYTFGIDSEIAFSEFINYIKPNEENERIKPVLINQCPPTLKPFSSIDPNIVMKHCFPNGFIPVEGIFRPKDELFHFSLDNLFNYSQYPKIYFTVLLFYESISLYQKVKKIYEELTSKDDKSDSKGYRNPKRQRAQSMTIDMRKRHKLETVSLYFNKKGRSYSYSSTLKRIRDMNFVGLYFPKAICLSSLAPFPEQKAIILKELYRYVRMNKITFPLEKVIEVLTMEVPMPPRGINKIIYKLFEKEIILYQQPRNSLNFSSYKMYYIFKFSIADIIEIYRNILLEIPILFFGTNKEELTNIVESFQSFIYPFQYQYPWVSILPEINIGLIEKEKCFVFGINKKFNKNFFETYNLNIVDKKIIIVDIDKGILTWYYYYDKELPMINVEDLGKPKIDQTIFAFPGTVQLPSRYKGKLYDRLNDLFKKMRKEKKNNLLNEEVNFSIASTFFYFIVSIINDYVNYMYNDEKAVKKICYCIKTNREKLTIYDIFKAREYLLECKEVNFYKNFFETKLFFHFISKRYLHSAIEDRLSILFFDESIIKKKNKKIKLFTKDIPTPFLDDPCFEFEQPFPKYDSNKVFSKSEISFILNLPSLKKSPINYFQHISQTKISYYLFPKLYTENYFFVRKMIQRQNTNLTLAMKYTNQCFKILDNEKYFANYNGDYVSQYQFITTKLLFEHEMEDYIFIIWIKLFALTFYYCDEVEKNFRFYEMLSNLKKITFLDRATFSLLFLTISKYGNEYMTIKLYETIEKYEFIPNYSEYAYLCDKLTSNIVYKAYKKKFSIISSKMSVVYFKESEDEYLVYEPTEKDIQSMKKRTFGCEDSEKEDEEIQFDSDLICPLCGASCGLPFFSMNFGKMGKDCQRCEFCNKPIAPNVKVKIGNNDPESLELCSPYYILQTLTEITSKYQTKLDLDTFRNDYSQIFWNCVWYFFLKGLSYDIILKYKHDNIKNNDEFVIQKNVTNLSYSFSICTPERKD